MSDLPDVFGRAALTICESLLLALNDRNMIPEVEIVGILKDAATTHDNAPPGDGMEATHKAVAVLIHNIIDGRNSVRRRRRARRRQGRHRPRATRLARAHRNHD